MRGGAGEVAGKRGRGRPPRGRGRPPRGRGRPPRGRRPRGKPRGRGFALPEEARARQAGHQPLAERRRRDGAAVAAREQAAAVADGARAPRGVRLRTGRARDLGKPGGNVGKRAVPRARKRRRVFFFVGTDDDHPEQVPQSVRLRGGELGEPSPRTPGADLRGVLHDQPARRVEVVRREERVKGSSRAVLRLASVFATLLRARRGAAPRRRARGRPEGERALREGSRSLVVLEHARLEHAAALAQLRLRAGPREGLREEEKHQVLHEHERVLVFRQLALVVAARFRRERRAERGDHHARGFARQVQAPREVLRRDRRAPADGNRQRQKAALQRHERRGRIRGRREGRRGQNPKLERLAPELDDDAVGRVARGTRVRGRRPGVLRARKTLRVCGRRMTRLDFFG